MYLVRTEIATTKITRVEQVFYGHQCVTYMGLEYIFVYIAEKMSIFML